MSIIKTRTAPEAWFEAARFLRRDCHDNETFDLFIQIAEPTVLSAADRAVYNEVDAFLTSAGGLSLDTVAETIFPNADYIRGGRKAVFETYPERMKTIHEAHPDRQWGCYAMRILRQTDLRDEEFNPLKDLLKKVESRKYKACYELGNGRPFRETEPDGSAPGGDIPIYDPATDRKVYRGHLPCLSHVSIKYDKRHDQVRLNATYRAHHYMQRALGNFVGLGRLLYFIAHEAGAGVGPLTINATYAKLDAGGDGRGESNWGYRDIDALLERCESLYENETRELSYV
ncbi:MAG: hypothetical protein WA989_04745 [Henriciella sp.]|uniref:hypothetical protein n=1 Tax=Henriciella sp. TaxID=1968823 RepID=UPI003C78FE78